MRVGAREFSKSSFDGLMIRGFDLVGIRRTDGTADRHLEMPLAAHVEHAVFARGGFSGSFGADTGDRRVANGLAGTGIHDAALGRRHREDHFASARRQQGHQ